MAITPPEIIETPEGPIPLPVAIPAPAPTTLHIPRLGDLYTWDDVHNWISSGIDAIGNLFSSVASVTIGDVKSLVADALSVDQTAWSSFVTWGIEYTGTVFHQLTGVTDALTSYVIGEVSFLSDEINYLEAVASYIVGTLAPGILDELHGLERWVVGAIDGAVADLRTWVIDDIASPLLDAIAAEGARVDDLIAHGLDTVRGEIADAVDNETLRRIAAVAALAAVVAAITDFVDNCGQPMCDVMGPKTDLGKLLKGLQAALLAADLAALLAMDEAELEATIAKLVTRGGQAISAFDEFFVGGTETIGDVIGNL